MITIQSFCNANGGHAGMPGNVQRSISLIGLPTPAGETSVNAALCEGLSVNFQGPTSSLSSALEIGKKYKIEITEVVD